jgi:hypothetical protein
MKAIALVTCLRVRLGVIVLVLGAAHVASAAQPQEELPPYKKIVQLTRQQFAEKKFGQSTLISRGDVTPLFEQFAKLGWKVADQRAILEQVLPDNDFMVRQLRRSDAGRFVRNIEKDPQGYDRIDRMRRLPRGHIFLSDLITNPGGYKLIDYMTNSPGGYNLGTMVSKTPDGKNFNKSTGRIYTVAQFEAQLATSYQQELARRKRQGPNAGIVVLP